ncbi:MAG TPA: alpha/beta hydrolase [Euzebyales bacterium]|nr:alpha/beta hydrolase [Euzebyales bacterium]
MHSERIHRAVSTDGTQIAGRVVGVGPPLVLIHGALYDGETAWTEMLPHLADRFTCYLPSTRGRGLSADDPDYAPERLLDDVVCFVESIGEPVPLVGWSGGAMWVLGAAARSGAVAAVVAYEPPVFEVMDEQMHARFESTVAAMHREVDEGRLLEAAQRFSELVATEEEQHVALASGRLQRAAPNVPADLRVFAEVGQGDAPSPTDAAVLSTISVPVLLLQGEGSASPWFAEGIRHVSAHLASCELRTIADAGHSAPGVVPEAVAAEVVRFLERVRQPVPAPS